MKSSAIGRVPIKNLPKKKKTMHPTFTKIDRVRPTVTCNIQSKSELNRMYHLNTFNHTQTHFYSLTNTDTHSHTHKNIYIHALQYKIAKMNSGGLKTYTYVKISKSNFFMITILSLCRINSNDTTIVVRLKKYFIISD